MKSFVLSAVAAVCLMMPSLGFGQETQVKSDHVEVGVFADYFRLDRTDPALNYAGLGGRLAFNLNSYAQIEGEMSYDFNRYFNNPFEDGSLVRSRTHILNGLVGPKIQTGSGRFRVFATAKAGMISFTTNSQNAPSGFRSALGAVGNGNAKFALYPGAGIEGFAGPFGLRLELGDDIYFDNGARNNLRVTFGPTFRF